MAQVFQCDSCEEVASKGGNVQVDGVSREKGAMKELCVGCFEKVMKVVEPPPRAPRQSRAPGA